MKKNSIKIVLWLVVFVSIIITFVVFKDTLALFETNTTGVFENDTGSWVIKINNQTLSSGTSQTIVINSFIYDSNVHVENGYIAPGGSAHFDLLIDATDCDVAVKFSIELMESPYLDNIEFEVVGLDNGLIQTDENVYTGVITLADIAEDEIVSYRVNLTWNDDEDYDESDTEIGSELDNKLSFPIGISAIQYLGEQIVEYNDVK